MPETPEAKLARTVESALDRDSFQGWAFAALINRKSAAIQKKMFLLCIDILKSFRAREEGGFSNNPTHTELGNMAIAMLDTYEKRGGLG